MPMAHPCHSLPEDLVWLQEDAAPTGETGQRCWEFLPPGAALSEDRQELGDEDLLTVPLDRKTPKACVTQRPRAAQGQRPQCPQDALPIKHLVFFPVLPPLTSPLVLPVITPQINYLHSNPISGSASQESQTKIVSLSVKEESSPGGAFSFVWNNPSSAWKERVGPPKKLLSHQL